MKDKIIFADQLRVLAFLSVVIVHWFGTFWIERTLVAGAIHAPILTIDSPGLYEQLVPHFLPGFNFGPFGVAIFFLISGFVIPFSCRSKSAFGFITSRALRIYPTYALSLSLTILVVYLSSSFFWGSAASFDIKTVLANVSLTQTLFMTQSIDLVNWTLAIEIKFYILCLLMRRFIINNNAYPFLILAVITIVINRYHTNFIGMLPMEMMFITFMSIGVIFNYHYLNKLSTIKMIWYSSLLLIIFSISLKNSQISPQYYVEMMCCIYALVVFSVCYYLRNEFNENIILKFLASISFPFYALHSVIGYCILRMLVEKGYNFVLSSAFTFICIVSIATIVHFIIEKRSIKWGKKFK